MPLQLTYTRMHYIMHISGLARPGLSRRGENINKYIIYGEIALLITYICMYAYSISLYI